MEALDIILATVKDVSYLAANHPLCSLVGAVVLFLSLMHFYCRLTLGLCDCQQDMSGKTVLITGASAGIGKNTAIDLARRNARVIMACRNIPKAQKAAEEIKKSTGNQNVIIKELDLCSFESVRKCAQDVLKTEKQLHVLINNAGIYGGDKKEFTKDGNELILQSNHLGHFLLTLLLIDLLKNSSPSRIINVASSAHIMANKLDPNDLRSEKESFPMLIYAKSKLANILFTKELARRLDGSGVTVNCLHPGVVRSEFLRSKTGLKFFFYTLFFMLLGKSSEEGAQTTIHLAVSPKVASISGKYFVDCKLERPTSRARDSVIAKRLFEASEKITGVSFK